MERIQTGHAVLILWNDVDSKHLESLAAEVRRRSEVAPRLECIERLQAAGLAGGAWHAALVTSARPVADEVLCCALRALRPRGVLLWQAPADLDAAASRLKLNGFVNAEQLGVDLIAEKPNFEVGSRSALRLRAPVAPGGTGAWRLDADDAEVAAAWGAREAASDELLDSDCLLGDSDRVRPDAAALRVCSTTGQRKACADCSCGLADELRAGRDAPKSSCGSCYLGDAFRCSTCPYLGTPAFQPGERVVLADLADDI